MFGTSFSQLPLDQIIGGCEQQKDGYCLELLCCAFDQKNQLAMTAVYHQYHKLVFDWVYKSSASSPYPLAQEDIEDIAMKAITKFFRHLERVDVRSTYKHIAQALGYCRKCVKTTVIDVLRAKARQAQVLERVIKSVSMTVFSDPSPSEALERQEQRQKIQELLKKHLSEQERLYLKLKFADGLKRREFPERFPEQFPSVKTVDRVWDRTKKALKKLFEIYLPDSY